METATSVDVRVPSPGSRRLQLAPQATASRQRQRWDRVHSHRPIASLDRDHRQTQTHALGEVAGRGVDPHPAVRPVERDQQLAQRLGPVLHEQAGHAATPDHRVRGVAHQEASDSRTMLPAEYQEVRLPLLREAADLDAWQAERDAELNGHRAPRPQLGVHPPLKPLEGRRRTVGADDTPHRGAEQRQRFERDHPHHGDTSECPFGEVQPGSHGGSSGLGLVGGDDNVANQHGSLLVYEAG